MAFCAASRHDAVKRLLKPRMDNRKMSFALVPAGRRRATAFVANQ
jgi:hypothetical protein